MFNSFANLPKLKTPSELFPPLKALVTLALGGDQNRLLNSVKLIPSCMTKKPQLSPCGWIMRKNKGNQLSLKQVSSTKVNVIKFISNKKKNQHAICISVNKPLIFSKVGD